MKNILSQFAATALCFCSTLFAQPDEPRTGDPEPFDGFNIESRTRGGQQFWADELVFRDWRIQRNVFTGHYRLLDGNDVRHAWGDYAACVAHLETIKRERSLEPLRGKVVVLVHGLSRTRKFMQPLGDYLRDKGGYEIVNVQYPSTRSDIATHAAGLAKVMENLKEAEEIHFVAHSLGNLVVRRYLADQTDEATGKRPDPRIKRFVMLGPPNQGSAMARMFENSALFHTVIKGTGRDLANDFDEISKHLATPACEFAIIAGGKGNDSGWNPLLAGDDDLLVRVSETKLPGARDFRLVDVRHSWLASEPGPMELTLNFLKRGCFTKEEERQEIPKE